MNALIRQIIFSGVFIYSTVSIAEESCRYFEESKDNRLRNTNFQSSLQQCAEQGSMLAQLALAKHYLSTNENTEEAEDWYHKAAGQGNAEAQYQLGVMYLEGKGVMENSDKALEWISIAASQRHPEAVKVYEYILYNDGPLEC